MATTRAADSTTRATLSRHIPASEGRHLLEATQVISESRDAVAYRVDRLIGAGGFGQAFLARRGRSSAVPDVCIKVSARIDGWVREAYFGQVLDDHERAIRVFDAFPLRSPDGRVYYCLVLESRRTAIWARS